GDLRCDFRRRFEFGRGAVGGYEAGFFDVEVTAGGVDVARSVASRRKHVGGETERLSRFGLGDRRDLVPARVELEDFTFKVTISWPTYDIDAPVRRDGHGSRRRDDQFPQLIAVGTENVDVGETRAAFESSKSRIRVVDSSRCR